MAKLWRITGCRIIAGVWIICLVAGPWPGPAEIYGQDKPNVLLICVDDLRPELGCYGEDWIHSPHIDRLASGGRLFLRHYVQAPTCGASRYALLTGRYGPPGNDALFARARQLATDPESVSPSMPAWFRRHGYRTVSVGKVSHHPGGRGGADWDDDRVLELPLSWDRHLMPAGAWQHPRGTMHGLADGEVRGMANQMDVFQSIAGPDTIYPDGLITGEALRQLEELAGPVADQPFFLAVGLIRPHLPFGAPARYYSQYADAEIPPIAHPDKPAGRSTWHGSGEFMKYNRWNRNPVDDPAFATEVRKHYAACVSYADAQIGKILNRLNEQAGARETIIVLWGDHGWHLGEHSVWGKHTLFEESLRAPLIISYAGIPAPGTATRSIVESIDVFPTLCALTKIPHPGFSQGHCLMPILQSPAAPGHSAISYNHARTIRTDTHRLIAHRDGFLELYDHATEPGETENISADDRQTASRLLQELNARLPADSVKQE